MKIQKSSRGALRTIYNTFALIVAISMLGVSVPQAQARGELGAALNTKALALALCTDNGRGSIKINNGNNTFVGTEHGKPMRVDASLKNGNASETAAAFLAQCGDALSAQSQSPDLTPLRENHSSDGKRKSVKFQQTFNGVPVLAGEMFVQLNENSDVLAVGGETLSNISLDTTPRLDATNAVARAMTYVSQLYGIDTAELAATEPELWIYDPSLLTAVDGPTELVWKLNVFALNKSLPINELTLINAHTGATALSFSQENFAFEYQIYNSNNDTDKSNDTEVCHKIDTNPDIAAETWDDTVGNCANGTANGDDTTEKVQENLEKTYNYFLNVLGHAGPIGNGRNGGTNIIKVYVHYGNATYFDQFNGEMIFGNDANAQARDIVAHEYGHIVISNTARLFQYYQSGAIAESMSDIFGEVIQHAGGYRDGSAVDWTIAARNMATPYTMTDLGTYLAANADCTGTRVSPQYFTTCDNGGIHTINAVSNYAAYTLASTVGSGWSAEEVSALYYEALTTGLTSGSDYTDLASALRQACLNLIGEAIGDAFGNYYGTVLAGDCDSLNTVLVTSGMDTQPASGGSPNADYCPTVADDPNVLFSDDMENSTAVTANWTRSGWNTSSLNAAYSPNGIKTIALWADDNKVIAPSESILTMTNPVTLAPTLPSAYLYFKHYYGFENGFGTGTNDGGVIESSIDGGTNWVPLSAVNMINGYNGVIDDAGNSLNTRPAFVKESRGYVGTRVDITSLKGNNVKFRWRMAVDEVGYDNGWFVDDVSVYSCVTGVIVSIPVSFQSAKDKDGDILEYREPSGYSDTATPTDVTSLSDYFKIGDYGADRQYRAILSFNTQNLPDTAVITDTKICIRKFDLVGTDDPFTWVTPNPIIGKPPIPTNLFVDIKKGFFGTGTLTEQKILKHEDFNAGASLLKIATFSRTPASTTICPPSTISSPGIWYYATIPSSSLYIGTTSGANTQLRLRFSKDDNDDMNDDYLRFYAADFTTLSYRPKLIVTYYIP